MNEPIQAKKGSPVASALKIFGVLAAMSLVLWLIGGRMTQPVQETDEVADGGARWVSVNDVRRETPDYARLVSRPKLADPGDAVLISPLLALSGDDLDLAIKVIVLDAGLSRSDKLRALWRGYRSRPDEAVRFLDWLRLFQPIELTSDLIAEFHAQTDLETRKALLAVLDAATDYVKSLPDEAPAEDWEFVGKETEKIQDLYKATARTAEAELRRQALLRLPALLPTEELGEFLELLNRDYAAGEGVISYDELLGVWVETVLADAEAQTTLLPKLLEHLKDEADSIKDEQVNARFYEMMKSASLKPEARLQLLEFLAGHEPVNASPNLFYDWLEAYVALVPEDQGKDALLRDYLLTGEARQQAGIIINQSADYWEQFTEEQLLAVIGNLGDGFRQAEPESKTAAQIQEALVVLSETGPPTVTAAATRQLEAFPTP